MHAPRLIGLALALLALATPPGLARASRPSESKTRPALIEAVRAARSGSPSALDAESLLERCEGSNESFAVLFELLETRQVPASEAAPPQSLSEAQTKLILAAFSLAPTAQIEALRDGRLGTLAREYEDAPSRFAINSRPARRAAIEVTGTLGCPEGVDRLFELALLEDEPELAPSIERAFEDALFASLQANDESLAHLLSDWFSGPSELVLPAVRAVGKSSDARTLSFLADVMRWAPEFSAAAAAQVRVIGPSFSADRNEALGALLISELNDPESAASAPACLALGGLRSEAAIGPLIRLLDHEPRYGSERPEGELQESALWALRQITGRNMGEDSAVWSLWHKEQKRWIAEQAPYWIKRIVSRKLPVAAEALRALAKRRFGRDRLAMEVARVLEVGLQEVRPLACAALQDLGSRLVVPELVKALESDSEPLRESAAKALRALTGRDLPADAESWYAALPELEHRSW